MHCRERDFAPLFFVRLPGVFRIFERGNPVGEDAAQKKPTSKKDAGKKRECSLCHSV